jgi:hypothetical protein
MSGLLITDVTQLKSAFVARPQVLIFELLDKAWFSTQKWLSLF